MRAVNISATLGLALLLGTPSSAAIQAADLNGPRSVQPPADFAPPYGAPARYDPWTGFYVGGTLGYGFGSGMVDGSIGKFSFDQEGALGTIFAGYNWQFGGAVLGLETDIGTGKLGTGTRLASGRELSSEIGAIGSMRARAGFLATPSLLLYGTAGLAWSTMEFGLVGDAHRSETFMGYQVGLGAETMISRNVGLRLEYIYTDFGSERVLHSGGTNTYDPDFHQVRAGLSFKF